MAVPRFKGGAGRKRQIKGSIGGGSKSGNLSRKAPADLTGGGGGGGGGSTPVVPDFTSTPLIPWDNNTKIGQLFNQGLVNLPSLNPVTNLMDPRLQGVAGDSMRERRDTYNRIAAAKRPATNPMDPRIKAAGVAGDSSRERMGTYNRIVSGRSPLQRPLQLSRMTGTQRGSAVARAGSANLRAGAAASRATATRAAATAAKPGVAKAAPAKAPVKKKATVVSKGKTTAMRAL